MIKEATKSTPKNANAKITVDTTTKPRRVYHVKGHNLVCFQGRRYVIDSEKSELNIDRGVYVERLPSDGGRARIRVSQKSTANAGSKWQHETLRSTDSL